MMLDIIAEIEKLVWDKEALDNPHRIPMVSAKDVLAIFRNHQPDEQPGPGWSVLERVARRLAIRQYHKCGLESLVPQVAEDYANAHWQEYIHVALAAIDALQQQTPQAVAGGEQLAELEESKDSRLTHAMRELSPDNPCPDHALRVYDICEKCGTPGFLEYLKSRGLTNAPSKQDAGSVGDCWTDSYLDDDGTVWLPPTAFAYAMVCKALERAKAAKPFPLSEFERDMLVGAMDDAIGYGTMTDVLSAIEQRFHLVSKE